MRWKRASDPRVRDELRYHRDRLIDEYIAQGIDPQEAKRRACLEFGSVTSLEEQVRDVRGRWLADFLQDVSYAWRTLRRSPAFAVAAILSLALGIGANAGIFSLINAVLLRSLPVTEPERLVLISRLDPDDRPVPVPFPFFEQLRDHLPSVSGITAVGTGMQTIVVDGDDELVATDHVSGSYFDVLGIRPAAGRFLSPADDVRSAETPAAVISDNYWDRRFGRDPAAIGKTVTIRDRPFTVVGVTPPAFRGIRPDRAPAVTLPLQLMLREEERQAAANWNNFTVIARLKPGMAVAQTNAEAQTLHGTFLRLQAEGEREQDRPTILSQRAAVTRAPDGFNPLRYEYGRSLIILMGSVGLVLLLACVNLSGLLLARAAARQREITIRVAIGAGRGRLVRQWLTESLVLVAIGATGGLLIASRLAPWLFSVLVRSDVAISVAPDGRVLVFTAAIAAGACLLAGMLPALHAVRSSLDPALRTTRAPGSGRLGKALVVAQLAISMTLLVGAALFIGTLVKLHAVDRGFDTSGVLVATVRTAQPYPAARIPAVKEALLEGLKALPGVRSASAAQVLPVDGGLWERDIKVDGHGLRDDKSEVAGFNAVAPAYFAAMGTPLKAGREFEARDTAASTRVAIVNESFARYFFGASPVLGRVVTSADVAYEIVGVVGDSKYKRLRDPIIKTMYIPWTQRTGDLQPSAFKYIMRVDGGDPRRLSADLRQAVTAADPALRLRTARGYDDLIEDSISTERVMAALGGVFGILALTVAGIGLFGVLAFQVSRRTTEIGVRMALGAEPHMMLTLVLREVAVMVAIGLAIGGAGAWAATRVARHLLFGLSPTDPAAFAIAATALAAAALLAGWLPARRASRIDPLVALRHE